MKEVNFRFPELDKHVANGPESVKYVRQAMQRNKQVGEKRWGEAVWPDSTELSPEIVAHNTALMSPISAGSSSGTGRIFENAGSNEGKNGKLGV